MDWAADFVIYLIKVKNKRKKKCFVLSFLTLILTFLLGYISTLRNNVRSRAWGAAIGCSYRVERCCIVKVISI